ncbi:hypothetical protein B0G76_1318 [Paraburkholderia sp. BL23I1N1]|uniref:hypothetical protein n=1 Tax=Paraburkholderia sp. BL23I1N1 TaxID=1938802 RepID=UPI000E7102EC|nr:hypothetical protein [Paraburkholderia sp. BL23I1N1]RKE35257.1 hypothetical protein B0G76_1318 [Paraburkholderia sp. BL23I1N1]
MRRRAQFRNEVKTRLSDRIYSGLQQFKALQGIDSDSAAMSRLLELQLFGTVGTLPPNLTNFSAEAAHYGTELAA